MTLFRSTVLLGAATVLLGQTPPPTPPTQPPQPPAQTPQIKMSVEQPPPPKMPEVPPDTVIITVGNVKITAAEFDKLIDTALPAQYRAIARGNGRKQYADNIVQMLTLAEEAQRQKLDQTADYAVKARFQNLNMMAQAMVEQISKDLTVSDADLHQYYDQHKADYETVHAKHILIRFKGSQLPVRPGQKDLTEEEALAKAQDIRKQLQGGGDFAALAKQESDDVGTGANGGDLPPFHHGQMVPSFETAAYALKPGELSEPVKSQFGYHIILVISHDAKGYDDVKADIEKTLKPQEQQKLLTKAIQDLEKTNPPVLDPVFFAPPTPPPAFTPVNPPAPPAPPVKK